jgi:hypothetical protein
VQTPGVDAVLSGVGERTPLIDAIASDADA